MSTEEGVELRRRDRHSRISALILLSVIVLGLPGFESYVSSQTGIPVLYAIPPPPSAPSWTYAAGSPVNAVAVSADGNRIVAVGASDSQVHVFARSSDTPIMNYSINGGANSLAVSANGNTTVVGTSSGLIQIFGEHSETPLWSFSAVGSIQSVAISADGNTIVGGDNDGHVYVLSRQSNVPLWTFIDDSGSASTYSVAVSKNGSTIVAGFMTGRYDVCVFGRQSNVSIWTYYIIGQTRSVGVSDDGNTIVSGTACNLTLFGRQSNQTIWSYKTNSTVNGVAVSRDGSTVAEGGSDYFLRVFNRSSDTPIIASNTTGVIYHALALSSTGSIIACGIAGSNHKVLLYSKTLGRQLWNYTVGANINSVENSGPAVGISGDGSISTYGCEDYKLYVSLYDTAPPILGKLRLEGMRIYNAPNNNHFVAVLFAVSVNDSFGVASVVMYYRIGDSSPWKSSAMNLTGNLYQGWIGWYPGGSNLTFYFNATDTSDNFACLPANAPLGYYWLELPVHYGFWEDYSLLISIAVWAAAIVLLVIIVHVYRNVSRRAKIKRITGRMSSP